MEIESISILPGRGKRGELDKTEKITLKMGDVISIVGPTGSGKTTLINDIALFASNNTPTGRTILINDEIPSAEFAMDPSKNPVAFITQHTNFLSDLPVGVFLETHAKIRKSSKTESIVQETIDFANQLTGEPIDTAISMTELSGGQTRSLLIADAVVIGNSPIILLDEIENAGIHRTTALELLKNYRKIFIFVTHDPRTTLLSDYRLVMGNGAIADLIITSEEEKMAVERIKVIDDLMLELRTSIRDGKFIQSSMIDSVLSQTL
jgi:ABC-type lipoprotein export system ATPase subunit